MSAAVRVCSTDGAPLVWTFEFKGAEYVCMQCGRTEGMLGKRAEMTPTMAAQHDAFKDQYALERAVREGRPLPQPVPTDIPAPTCKGCGRTAGPEDGRVESDGKPSAWYKRTRDGVEEFACSGSCIPSNESVLPW